MKRTVAHTKPTREKAHLTLSKLREAKIAKDDFVLKRLFSLQNGSLRSILGVPQGIFLREEFPNLEYRRSDALVYSNGVIHHVEFQTKNDAAIPARLHEYAYLIDRYKDDYGVDPVTNLSQLVVYVGPDSCTMTSPYRRWGTEHRFDSFDIRSRYSPEQFDRLWKSNDPNDWVIAVLLVPKTQFEAWHVFEVASAISDESWIGRKGIEDTKVLLLIAAILRKFDNSQLVELETMMTVNVGASSLLREMYDTGGYETAIKDQLDSFERLMVKRDVAFSDPQREYMAQFNAEAVEELFDLAIDGDFGAILKKVTPPSPGLKLEPSEG